MQRTFICKHCNKEKELNPRLKGKQEYCSDITCKRAYKRVWQKEKMLNDVDYNKSQKELVKQWQKNKPNHEYQRQYRECHPKYVTDNRSKQKARNQKAKDRATLEKIVKMDSLASSKSSYYTMVPYKLTPHGKIVKMDSLIIKLQLLQGKQHKHTTYSSEL